MMPPARASYRVGWFRNMRLCVTDIIHGSTSNIDAIPFDAL
jgi:hypothetical protein